MDASTLLHSIMTLITFITFVGIVVPSMRSVCSSTIARTSAKRVFWFQPPPW